MAVSILKLIHNLCYVQQHVVTELGLLTLWLDGQSYLCQFFMCLIDLFSNQNERIHANKDAQA